MAHADVVIGLVGPDGVGEVVGDPPQERESLGVLPGLEVRHPLQVERFEEQVAVFLLELLARLLEGLEVAEVADRVHLLAAGEGVLAEGEVGPEPDRVGRVLLDDRLQDLRAAVMLSRIEQLLPLTEQLEGGVVAPFARLRSVGLALRRLAAGTPLTLGLGRLRQKHRRQEHSRCDRDRQHAGSHHRHVIPPHRRRLRSGAPFPRAAGVPRSTARSWDTA